MAIALPYGTFGVWKALRFLLKYTISRDSNREEETVLSL